MLNVLVGVTGREGEPDAARSLGNRWRANGDGVDAVLSELGRDAQRFGFGADDPRHDRAVSANVELRVTQGLAECRRAPNRVLSKGRNVDADSS